MALNLYAMTKQFFHIHDDLIGKPQSFMLLIFLVVFVLRWYDVYVVCYYPSSLPCTGDPDVSQQ